MIYRICYTLEAVTSHRVTATFTLPTRVFCQEVLTLLAFIRETNALKHSAGRVQPEGGGVQSTDGHVK